MKALLYGRNIDINRIGKLLENEGLEVQACEDNPYEFLHAYGKKELDLAVIDSNATDAAGICSAIRETGDTTIALLVNPKYADWNRIQSIDTNCYLTETRDNNEMAARIRAVLRRYSLEKMTGQKKINNALQLVTN